MPDGDAVILGTTNSANGETRITRSGSPTNSALFVRNENGVGISAEGEVLDPAAKGTGVLGRSTHGYGVVGTSPSDGTGVRGESSAGAAVEAVSSNGVAVRAISSVGPGVDAHSDSGVGVAGRSVARDGVFGSSTNRFGVLGDSLAAMGVVGTSSRSIGVQGLSREKVGVEGMSRTGTGVVGFANSGVGVQGYTALVGMDTSRPGTGVAGRSDSGIGVRGDSISGTAMLATSKEIAIRAHSDGNLLGGTTVHASAQNDCIYGGSDTGTGITGISHRSGTGVHGWAARSGVGVRARTEAGIAVRAHASSGIGILASSLDDNALVAATAPGKTAAVFFGKVSVAGGATVFGPKSAAVPHPDGSHRRLYSLEAPESWFEDFGRAELVRGHADVALDPDFVAVVRSDDYHVFLTPEGDSSGLYVSSRDSSGFEVREQQGGASTLSFSYRVVAKRGDIDGPRFEFVEPPEPVEIEEPWLDLPDFPEPPPPPPEPPEQREFREASGVPPLSK